MSAVVMTKRVADASPRLQARLAGIIALITTSSGYAAIVNGGLIVLDDAATTAHNILAHEMLFRLAVAGDVLALLYIAYTLLLYNLFRPVSRSLWLLAAFFSLVGCAVGAVNSLLLLAPMVVLGGGQSLGAFSLKQVQALALMFLKLHAQGGNISMVLFGSYNLLIGYLIVRSTFLPRVLGVLLAISGVGYLINSFANILSPDFAAHLLPYILIPGGAEILLALWFAVAGVNERRWREQASAQGSQSRVIPSLPVQLDSDTSPWLKPGAARLTPSSLPGVRRNDGASSAGAPDGLDTWRHPR
jgi:hypothetical protein